jgi:uncharacterized membrane protein
MDYTIVKWLHVLSSTVIFGTGIGSAFFMFMANRTRNTASIYFAAKHVVLADWVFTTPAVVFQLISGIALVEMSGARFGDVWIKTALALYIVVGFLWLPVLWMQIRMRDMAARALRSNAKLPAGYLRFERWWTLCGSLAFPLVIVIFWVMIAKPT